MRYELPAGGYELWTGCPEGGDGFWVGDGNEVPPILWCSLAFFSNAAMTSGAVEFSIGSLSGCRHTHEPIVES